MNSQSSPNFPEFHSIWYAARAGAEAKITCRFDLLTAVLGGMIEASTLVRSDGSDRRVPAADHPAIAPLLTMRARLARSRWILAMLAVLIGIVLILPIFNRKVFDAKAMLAMVFVIMMLRENYQAAISAVELSRGRQILLFVASIVIAVIGFVVADAATEFCRLLLFTNLPENSDWLTLALFFLLVILAAAISTFWERFEPDRGPSLKDLPAGPRKSALVAQQVAKSWRLKGIVKVGSCKSRVWPDGTRYEGAIQNGKQHGPGVVIWPDGRRYEGHWVKGRRTGYGVLVGPDGSESPGKWQDDRRLDEAVQ